MPNNNPQIVNERIKAASFLTDWEKELLIDIVPSWPEKKVKELMDVFEMPAARTSTQYSVHSAQQPEESAQYTVLSKQAKEGRPLESIKPKATPIPPPSIVREVPAVG